MAPPYATLYKNYSSAPMQYKYWWVHEPLLKKKKERGGAREREWEIWKEPPDSEVLADENFKEYISMIHIYFMIHVYIFPSNQITIHLRLRREGMLCIYFELKSKYPNLLSKSESGVSISTMLEATTPATHIQQLLHMADICLKCKVKYKTKDELESSSASYIRSPTFFLSYDWVDVHEGNKILMILHL